ncbi:hypothetical protein MMC07_001982 [Pseudocyphellaria aurata]|nr:hypothetical protein [Pseudocyphellaria aurata]
MANQVIPQVDVGGLTLQGLSAFGPLLASISADNVVPTAMIQMENLGGRFLISGEYAAKVPDYLQRCSSVRLERLALTIGWRKGDAASLMAGSAGGQAVALLSLCLLTLYTPVEAGRIFLDLSKQLLPSIVAISSVLQLAGVGNLLKAKLETLGFGNLLAKQVTKVHDAYKHMDLAVPDDFLHPMSPESMTELLGIVSRALQDETKIVRITGTYALGHILGIVLMMFPRDTLVTINGFVFFEGTHKSILIEFEANGQDAAITKFQLETLLPKSAELSLPFQIEPCKNEGQRPRWSFSWNNWVAHLLQLEFLSVGLTCPREILSSCCDVLMQLPASINKSIHLDAPSISNHLPRKGLLNSLGPDPYQRICNTCQMVYGSSPSGWQLDLPTAFLNLAQVATKYLDLLQCSCRTAQPRCNATHGWWLNRLIKTERTCRRFQLWNAIGLSLNNAFLCLFMNVGTNISMSKPSTFDTVLLETINRVIGPNYGGVDYYCSSFHRGMTKLISDTSEIAGIGVSSGANAIFPAALRDTSLTPGLPIVYEVHEGKFMFEGRYHMALKGAQVTPRTRARKNLPSRNDQVAPTSAGEHETLVMTLRECFDFLELRAMVRVSGQNVSINLAPIIISSYGLEETEPCSHHVDIPLDPLSKDLVVTTSVASPATNEKTTVDGEIEKKTSIVQTKHNPAAQLLCCEEGVLSLLLKECCLDCALSQIRINKYVATTMIIV